MLKAADLVRDHQITHQIRNTRGMLSFSITKANLHMLDRVGDSTFRNFRVFTIDEVLSFVKWDLYHNTLFEVWGAVL